MDFIALVLDLLANHPHGKAILVMAFHVFSRTDAEGYDREEVCKRMIRTAPKDANVSASQIYALSELYDVLPSAVRDAITAKGQAIAEQMQ